MKKILFAYYPFKVHYNHGIRLLSSILREKGIEVFVTEISAVTDIQKIIDESGIDFVGFSLVSSPEYNVCLPYMREAKKSGKPVLAGGVYVRRGSYIDPDAVDYICRGEGEILADFILNGKTEVFDKPYFQDNLDGLPLSDYSGLTGYEFDREIPFLKGLKIIPYHSSRGCPYECTFCEVRYQPKGLRIKHTIREDMKKLGDRFSPDLFHIMDELIPYYLEEWRDLFDGNPYPFMSYIRADITQHDLEFLIANGLKVAIFGIESGDEKYRNEVLKKNLLDSEIIRTVLILQKNNINYVPFFMTGGPFETEKIKTKTIKLARIIGGFPVIWQYEDLSKRVFSIDKNFLGRYAERIGAKEENIKKILNDTTVNVISKKDFFIAYQIIGKGMFIHEISGRGPSDAEVVELCKIHGADKYFGIMKKDFPKFNHKFGVENFGFIIGKEL